ncbi:MAG: hypothetical protein ACKO5C_07050 [Ferruginibacter sp.]
MHTRTWLLVIALLTTLCVNAQRIVMDYAGLRINNLKVTKNTTPEALSKALNESPERYDLANTIYSFKSKGVLAYYKPGTERLTQITIELIQQEFDFSCNQVYSGDCLILGRRVNSETTLEEMRKIRGIRFLTNPVYQYEAMVGSLKLYVFTIEQTKELEDISITIP